MRALGRNGAGTRLKLGLIFVILAIQVGVVSSPPAAADPAVTGQWGAPFSLGIRGIHSMVMPNGKVLLYSYPVSAVGSDARVYNPATGTITDVSLNRQLDVFCAATSLLPDGRVFNTGGHVHGIPYTDPQGIKNTTFFDPATNAWTDGPLMTEARWYPSNVVLGDGKTLIFSGQESGQQRSMTVESYNPSTNTITTLPSTANRYLGWYPKLHLMPSGKILWDNTTTTMTFNPATSTWSTVGPTQYGSRRDSGTSVLLPGLNKVLIAGGGGRANATAEIIDFSSPTPQWRYTAPMNYARVWANATLLADGTVLMVGGGASGHYKGPVRTAELFDPVTETWTVMATQAYARMYHSTSVLLPDGRVFSAGHDHGNVTGQVSGEIYSPPYLFKGPRPTIGSAPSSVTYGQGFSISSPEAASISRVALIRPGSVTHSADFEQRYVDLSWSYGGGSTLNATAPANGTLAPPGYYMLVIVNASGVPSVASWVHVA